MYKILSFIVVISLVLSGCTGGASDTGKAPGRGGRDKNRTLSVDGYLAVRSVDTESYSADGALLPMDQVEVKAETSGKLVGLYVKDGQSVSKGMLLAKLDDSELRADLKEAQAKLDYAEKQDARGKTLYEKSSITLESYEGLQASAAEAEASVELIQAQLKKTEIRAPFAGKLGVVEVSRGAWMTSGALLATLSDVRSLKVEFTVPQRYASSLRLGGTVSIRDGERSLSANAKVRFLDATLSETSRTRKVRAVMQNPDGKFLGGSFVQINVPLTNANVRPMQIPAEALTLDYKGAYVFVAKSGKAVRTYVETGLRTPISVAVESGLSEGDTVIVTGLMNMRDGSNVKIKDIRNAMHYEVNE